MRKYKISVVIPCYNQGQYIDSAVDSVLNQTYQDFEILVINDGSDDEFTINKLSKLDRPKTRIINTENQGLSAARNNGFKVADGELIQFLDADDIILPGKLEEQTKIFDHYSDVDVCYTNFRIHDIKKGIILPHPSNELIEVEPLLDFLFRWERGLSIPIHCSLFKKRIWDSKLPFNEGLKAKEDWLMWCELALKQAKFYFLNKDYAEYRFHENNMTNNIVKMNYDFGFAAFHILQIIPEKLKKEFLKKTVIHINSSLETNLYPDMANQIVDLKNKFTEMDKTIDYKIGHTILKPYRLIKTKVLGKKYL
jgi:O-antigen biosynthesis protein